MGRVLVALSGGVDSAVAALLLKQQGFDVSCAYIRSWMNEAEDSLFDECPWEEDIRMCRAVCEHLEVPFEVIDFIREYREKVVDYLVDGYRRGLTPNPDVMCNREMKFGLLRQFAEDQGFDWLATGHYCRRCEREDGSVEILEGLDPNKDQSYFLAMVTQEQVRRVLFPVGELTKDAVRALASEHNLPNASRKDSQGICFLGKVDINRFLARYIDDRPGAITRATDGEVLGEHRGLHRFTLGQRKGIGIPSNTDHKNYVVVAKDYLENRLMVAFDEPDAPGLYGREFRVNNLNWLDGHWPTTFGALARPRYRDPKVAVRCTFSPDGSGEITFLGSQRALAGGQVVAFYENSALRGGATFF